MSDQLLTQLTQELLHYQEPKRERSNWIYISEIKECIRKQYYAINNTEPDTDRIPNFEKAKFTMAYGNLFETYLTQLLDRLKIPWKKHRIENEELHLHGETDPIIKYHDKEIILEAKGIHQRQFDLLYGNAKLNIPPDAYYSQLQAYLYMHPQADYGAFIIGNRNMNPQDKGPPFFLQEIQRDKLWYDVNFQEPDGRIPKLNLFLDTHQLPPREFDNRTKAPCSYCIFNRRCWEKDV